MRFWVHRKDIGTLIDQFTLTIRRYYADLVWVHLHCVLCDASCLIYFKHLKPSCEWFGLMADPADISIFLPPLIHTFMSSSPFAKSNPQFMCCMDFDIDSQVCYKWCKDENQVDGVLRLKYLQWKLSENIRSCAYMVILGPIRWKGLYGEDA